MPYRNHVESSVFISYRRRDSVAHVHALYGRLVAVLGTERVFMDVDNIALGTDFMQAIHRALDACDVLIAVIGRQWAGGEVTGERRIDRPDDVVRLEIAEALRRGMRVVPLFVDGVEPLAADRLPDDLRALALRQGFSVRDDRFADDMELFVLRVRRELAAASQAPPDTRATLAPPSSPTAPQPASAAAAQAPANGATDPGLAWLATSVQRHWIDGVLKPNLGAGAMIPLRLRRRADLVPNPFADLVNAEPVADPPELPETLDTDLWGLFIAAGRRLLLLGEAGAGKTTSLLGLAQRLLDTDSEPGPPQAPIPVVLHLGSWRPDAAGFAAWMCTEINRRYRVPLDRARRWLGEQRLLPLLDGLDELPRELQAPCVDAIQTWAHQDALPGYVVCCRRADYERLPTRLGVGEAAQLLPLDETEMRALWRSRGVDGAALDRLTATSRTRALGGSPLLARMAAIAGQASTRSTEQGSTDVSALLDAYIGELFRRAPPARRAPAPRQLLPTLAWISRRLSASGQSQLQLEALDVAWLTGAAQRWAFALAFGILIGLLVGTLSGVYWWVLTPNLDLRELGCTTPINPHGTCVALRQLQPLWTLAGVCWGLVMILIDPLLPERPAASFGRLRGQLLTALIALLYFLLAWLVWWGLSALLGHRLVLGPITLSAFALAVVIAAWRAQRPGLTGTALTVEAVAWDTGKALRGMAIGLPVALGLWGINALLLGEWILEFLPSYLLIVLPVGAVFGGLQGRALPRRIHANEGIRLSARNAAFALAVFGVAGSLAGAALGLTIWEAAGDRSRHRQPRLARCASTSYCATPSRPVSVSAPSQCSGSAVLRLSSTGSCERPRR
jgi:hypothetical protein